jgi:hypothetical protein
MRWKVVQVVIEFLDIFTVVALVISETKKSFFQYAVSPIPQTDGEAKVLEIV